MKGLELFLDVYELYVGAQKHEIRSTKAAGASEDGVHVDVITFQDSETAENADGALFTIDPHKFTKPKHWTGNRVYAASVDWGSGHWIGVNPEGERVVRYFPDESVKKSIEYGPGWTGAWVAGPDGLQVIEVRTPPYEPSDTQVVEPYEVRAKDGLLIPVSFWEAYFKVRSGDILEDEGE